MVDAGYREQLEVLKAQSTIQLLFKAARLLNERAIEAVRRRTKLPVRVAHTALFPHVELEGARLTDLASRLEVSKQAVGQLVDELVEMGLLERVPDPSDARAKLVRYSARGREGILEALATFGELERDLVKTVGAAEMKTLHAALAAIVAEEMARE